MVLESDSGVSMKEIDHKITGPLQEKIMMILRDDALCGVDIMNRLNIKSPGTIYPVLEVLRRKLLIDYRVEAAGAIRKKMYFLTDRGQRQFKDHLVRSAKIFCCDHSLHMQRILENMKELAEIEPNQNIVCTLEYEEVKKFLKGAKVTFSYDLDVPSESYDLALSLLGVGCLIGKETKDVADYVRGLNRSLKEGGSLLIIEIEKSDNIFTRIFFEDIVGLKEMPGLTKEELERILERNGFENIKTTSRSGLLYSLSYKK